MNRRAGAAVGAALPIMIFVLTMMSALAVTGLFVTRQLAATASAAQHGAELEPEAERALVDAVAQWDTLARSEQPLGTVAPLSGIDDPGVRTEAWVTRIDERTYWLVAESRSAGRPPLRRRIGLVVRVTEGVAGLVSQRAWSELP